jgi:hypothetical protein
MPKEKKSERELIELLMSEVQKHSECAHVMSVKIIKPTTQNWQAAWVVDGTEMACRRAFAIADELQAKFDLA